MLILSRRHYFPVFQGFMLLILFASCSKKQNDLPPETFKALHPLKETAFYNKEYVADINSVRYVEVRSRIRGHVERIYVDEGMMVSEGQLLFSVSSREFELELQKASAAVKVAEADLKAAEVDLYNVQPLVEKNIVSKAELEMTKAKVTALKAKVDEALAHEQQALLNLSFSQIRAPYKGKINRIPNKVGSLVHEQDVLTTISDNSEVFAYFHMSEIDYLNYIEESKRNNNQSVKLRLTNGQMYAYEGKIEITESEFDQTTGNIAFRARFPNPEGLLKHGSNGKIILPKLIENAIQIPQRSTFEIQDKIYVFVVGPDSIVEQRNILTSIRLNDMYVVSRGLTESELIIFEGVQSLKNGHKVSPSVMTREEILSAINLNQ